MQEVIIQSPVLAALVQELLKELDDLPQNAKTSAALAVASSLLEYAAYEMAQTDEAQQVARLILLAADMERTAQDLREKCQT